MKEFFDNGGTTTFIDRLCGSLGIHASTVKVVGVFDGSVQVDYEITPSKDEPLSIAQIQAKQTEKFATGQVELGAPVLDVSGNGESIIADGVVAAAGFAPKILVVTSTNQGSVIWIDWVEPFLWEAAQVLTVDAPSNIVYNGLYGGLAWVWKELSYEVKDLAKSMEMDEAHEEHMPNAVPEEGDSEPKEDDGNVQAVGDDGDLGGL